MSSCISSTESFIIPNITEYNRHMKEAVLLFGSAMNKGKDGHNDEGSCRGILWCVSGT